jgi:hypothetical protein
LPSQCSKHDRPVVIIASCSGGHPQAIPRLIDRLTSHPAHLLVLVQLPSEALGVGVVAEGRDERIGDHDGLEVEATVANVAARRSAEVREGEERA